MLVNRANQVCDIWKTPVSSQLCYKSKVVLKKQIYLEKNRKYWLLRGMKSPKGDFQY